MTWGFLTTLAVLILEFWIFVDYRDTSFRILGIIIGFALGSIWFYYVGIKIHYLERPKSIEVSDEGIKLNMRLGKRPVIIAWPDVRTIELITSFTGKQDGMIRNDIAWYYPIDRSIALELRGAYHQHMGKYPPKNLKELCPGIVEDRLSMSSSQWNRKYERFKKKN